MGSQCITNLVYVGTYIMEKRRRSHSPRNPQYPYICHATCENLDDSNDPLTFGKWHRHNMANFMKHFGKFGNLDELLTQETSPKMTKKSTPPASLWPR